MKQRSADPGVGSSAWGSNSLPYSWRFIWKIKHLQLLRTYLSEQFIYFWIPEGERLPALISECYRFHPEDLGVECDGDVDAADRQDQVVKAVDHDAILIDFLK